MIAPVSPMTLTEFFKNVYRPLRMIDASPATAQQYEVAIARFSAFLKRPATLADLTETTIAEWMAAGRAAKLAPATVNSRRRMLVTLWRFAKRKRLIDRDTPEDLENVEPLREPKRVPTAWTLAELERLLKSCRLARGRFAGVPAAAWWTALVLVMYDTGLRRSAVFAIRFEEIDFAEKLLRVPAERMKNGVEQWYRLSDQTIAAILESLPPQRALLFPFPFTQEHGLYSRFRFILRRAGLPFTRKDMFHKIRRTTASHIAAAQGKAAAFQQLGHQDASCIARYVDPRFISGHDGAKHLPRPGGQPDEPVTIEALPEPEVKAPRTYRVASSLLSGATGDLFADLAGKVKLERADVVSAIAGMGLRFEDFAKECGVSQKHLRKVLRGQRPLSADLEARIRIALGIAAGREGETDRIGERLK